MRHRVSAFLQVAAFAIVSSVAVPAHDVIYKGTVRSVDLQKIEVQVIDDKTRKESPMVFEVTSQTKIYRGDQEVTFAEAKVQKNERIVVTVNHDVSPTRATIVRLAAR